MTDLAPPQRGFFYDQRNQRCGWAFGWWACVLERQARYGNKHDPPSPANLAGLLFGDPCPLRWLPADARRMPRAHSAEAAGEFFWRAGVGPQARRGGKRAGVSRVGRVRRRVAKAGNCLRGGELSASRACGCGREARRGAGGGGLGDRGRGSRGPAPLRCPSRARPAPGDGRGGRRDAAGGRGEEAGGREGRRQRSLEGRARGRTKGEELGEGRSGDDAVRDGGWWWESEVWKGKGRGRGARAPCVRSANQAPSNQPVGGARTRPTTTRVNVIASSSRRRCRVVGRRASPGTPGTA